MNKNFLRELLSTYSPSGYECVNENNVSTCVERYLCEEENIKYEFNDTVGNICFSTGSDSQKTIRIMLSGHCDEIAAQVQYIDDNGFIHFIKDGGIDLKAIIGSSVSIIRPNSVVHGIIGKKPIHVEGEDKEKVGKLCDYKINIGAKSKEEALHWVEIGDPIIFNGEYTELLNNNFTSRGIDDKVGVYVAMEALKRLSKLDLKNVRVYACTCPQEETSGIGAIYGAQRIEPNYSIDYDVTFATDDGYVKKEEWGDIKLGNGVALANGVDTNYKFANLIRETARLNKLPLQQFSVRSGCTNTFEIKSSVYNCMTALLSIPQLNMHTQREVANFDDLESAINLTVATILKIEQRGF